MQRLRGILSATDFSGGAGDAVELALRLAAATGEPLTLVHVCEDSDEHEEGAARRLATLVEELRGGLPVSGVLRSGRVAEKIENVAVEVGAGLIVVGRRGAGEREGLGAVAERLACASTRPVVIVPRRASAPSGRGSR